MIIILAIIMKTRQNGDQANNDIWSRVLGGQKDRREQIACSSNEDATMDKG